MNDINSTMRGLIENDSSFDPDRSPTYTCTVCRSPYQCKHKRPDGGTAEHKNQHTFRVCCSECWDMEDIPF